jgi:hypothetical protein
MEGVDVPGFTQTVLRLRVRIIDCRIEFPGLKSSNQHGLAVRNGRLTSAAAKLLKDFFCFLAETIPQQKRS